MEICGIPGKLFAFYFCLVKGKVAFLSVFQIMRKVRIYTNTGKEAITSRIQYNSVLIFGEDFSVRCSLPNRPEPQGRDHRNPGLQAHVWVIAWGDHL